MKKPAATGSKLKSGAGPSAKGSENKSAGSLGLTNKTNKNLPSTSTSNKYYSPNASSKNHKSSFTIIWIPTKRHNKKKNIMYNTRDRSRERSPSMYNFMSGDSSENPLHKKDEEINLLVPEKKPLVAAVASTGAAASVMQPPLVDTTSNPSEKQDLLKFDKEESKEAGGDGQNYDKNDNKENSESTNNVRNNTSDNQSEKDKVDSVYLRPSPANKTRSTTSTPPEEEDCGIKCLYYTLQCCDCVLM